MELGSLAAGKLKARRRWEEHLEYGKSVSAYFEMRDFVVEFLQTGWMDKYIVREFDKVVKTYKQTDDQS